MTRWLLRAAAVTVGFVSPAAAQQLPPAALANTPTVPGPAARAAAPDDGPVVLLMRTTGQPDRKLRVVKRSSFLDGESLVDVQDVASGQTFTIPGKLADRLPRADLGPPAAPPPTQRLLSPPNPLVQPPLSAVGAKLPVAVAGSGSPQLVPRPLPGVAIPGDTVLTPVPSPTVAPPTPGVNPVVVPAPAANPTPATGDRWKIIPPPQPTPTPSPIPPLTSADDGIVVRGQMPASLGGRQTTFASSPATAPPSPAYLGAPGALPSQEKLLPNALPRLAVPPAPKPPAPLKVEPAPPPAKVDATFAPKMPTVIPPAPPVVESPKPPVTRLLVVPAPAAAPVPDITPSMAVGRTDGDDVIGRLVRQEMQPYETDLTTALRPSVRMAAANGLAELRYAARPEVKAALVRGALTDPAAAVRTECVRALTELGYMDPQYATYLESAVADRYAPETLRLAAAEALRRLRPRHW